MTAGGPVLDPSTPAWRRWDDRVVPRLQRASSTTVARLTAPAFALHRLERGLLGGRPYALVWRRRAVLRTVAVVLALAGSAVHLQRYPALLQAREAERAEALQQTIRSPVLAIGNLPDGAIVQGPQEGSDIGEYILERQGALADVGAERRAAIVSLHAFSSVERIVELLGEGAVIVRAQYQMPDARATPLDTEVVKADLAASIARIVDAELAFLAEEQSAQQELLDSGIDDERFARDARNRVDEIRTVRNILAADGRVVFAVVVVADGAVLRDLARDELVRLVDVLPAGADPVTSVLFGLKPDDVGKVTFGVPPQR